MTSMVSLNESPEPASLYKFLRAPILVKHVLSSLTLQWSSPVLFNDPFDCQTDAQWDRHLPDFGEQLEAKLRELVHGPRKFGPSANAMLASIRRISDPATRDQSIQRFARRVAESYQTTPFEKCDNLPRLLRVLCLTERLDYIPMWSHYADQHTGMAVELDAVVLRRVYDDGPLLKVRYSSVPPRAQTAVETICNGLLGEETPMELEMGYAMLSTKADAWREELEWRHVHCPEIASADLSLLRPFPPEAVKSIVLGCRVSDSDRVRVETTLDQDRWKHVRLRRLKVARTGYSLVE